MEGAGTRLGHGHAICHHEGRERWRRAGARKRGRERVGRETVREGGAGGTDGEEWREELGEGKQAVEEQGRASEGDKGSLVNVDMLQQLAQKGGVARLEQLDPRRVSRRQHALRGCPKLLDQPRHVTNERTFARWQSALLRLSAGPYFD